VEIIDAYANAINNLHLCSTVIANYIYLFFSAEHLMSDEYANITFVG